MALGVPDPTRLLRELPAPVWGLWRAYEVLEPWRLEDEPARTYPVPPREQVSAQLRTHLAALKAMADRGVRPR